MEYAGKEAFPTAPRPALARLSSHWRKVFKNKCSLGNLFTNLAGFSDKIDYLRDIYVTTLSINL